MKFYEFGVRTNPVIVMLPGSFCPAKAMDYLYQELMQDYDVIVAEYNGHYENSTFTTRQNEAKEIADHLSENGIVSVRMILGHSMGSEIGIELLSQLTKRKISVSKAFFDGAPCIKLSKAYKAFMYFKFRTLIRMMRDKSIEEVIGWKFLNQFTNGDTESLRPMIASLIEVAPYLTKESIRRENECCYTFDFPEFPEDVQRRMYFFYAREEKAFKTCYQLVKRAYPKARYKVVGGYGHLTYSVKNKDEYIRMIRKICG